MPQGWGSHRAQILCAGRGMDALAFESMGVLAQAECADIKAKARRMLLCIFAWAKDIFFDNTAFITGAGKCAKHQDKECQVDDKQEVHIASSGLPCQPCTHQHSHVGHTASLGRAELDPLYPVAMEQLPQYLEVVKPHCWVVEEVEGFQLCHRGSTVSYLKMFCKRVSARGYAVRAVALDHAERAAFPRPRTRNE